MMNDKTVFFLGLALATVAGSMVGLLIGGLIVELMKCFI